VTSERYDPPAAPNPQTVGETVSTGTAQQSQEKTEESARRALTFGKYRLFARLGTGGMADVYLAVAQGAMNVNRLVVIKRLRDEHANDEATREMFVNEARLAARLNHPNVIQTNEAGAENGTYFLAMEYVDGQPMSRLLNKMKREGKRLEPRIAARIVSDALNGLHYAHELCDFDETPLEIVHRDVSPQNVMITYEGAVKLVDFGIAKAVGTTQTAHGVFKGKVAFMAPEQVTLDKVDRRADIFAAGIVLWEAVTGKPLMGDSSPAKTLYNLLNKPVPRASSENPDVPAALDDAISKALQRNVNDRFQTAREMREALEGFIATAGGVSTEEVGKLLKDLFKDTRDKVQAQIKSQLKTLSLSRTSEIELSADINNTAIRSTGMLIDLGEGAGLETASHPSLFRVVSSANNPMPPSTGRKIAMVAWVGATLLALGASGVAIMRSQKNIAPAPTAATATAAPEPTPSATTPPSATSTPSATATAEAPTSSATSSATAPATTTATAAAPPPRQTWVARPAAPPQPHPAAPAPSPEPTKAAPTPTTATTTKPDPTQPGRTFRREL